MASMSSFVALDKQALCQIRKTAENPPRVSVYDVIEAITGQSNPRVIWDRLCTSFPEVVTICYTFKFPGRGQQDTPVADARGITEIILILPGKAAAHFRKAAADVVVRYLGGDPSVVEEIAANRLAQESLGNDHPARIFGQAVESEAVKRKREELELVELDGQIKAAKRRAVTEGLEALQHCGLPVDDRDRIRAKDMLNQITFEQPQVAAGDREICVRHFLQQQGIRDAKMDSRLGKAAKALFLADNPDYIFPKKDIYANGQMITANVWYAPQRLYLERALDIIRGATQTTTRAATQPTTPRTLSEMWG